MNPDIKQLDSSTFFLPHLQLSHSLFSIKMFVNDDLKGVDINFILYMKLKTVNFDWFFLKLPCLKLDQSLNNKMHEIGEQLKSRYSRIHYFLSIKTICSKFKLWNLEVSGSIFQSISAIRSRFLKTDQSWNNKMRIFFRSIKNEFEWNFFSWLLYQQKYLAQSIIFQANLYFFIAFNWS